MLIQTPVHSPIEAPAGTVQLRGAAALVYHSTDSEVLTEGRAGTGKTVGHLLKIYHNALRYPRCRQVICRFTRKSLTQGALVTWEEEILGATHPLVRGAANRDNREEYKFENGSVVATVGLDDPGKLFSTQWDLIYVNELTEGISLEAWELFNRALRNYKIPHQQLIADCNPGAPSHWANKRATPCTDQLRNVRTAGDYRRLQQYNQARQPGKMRRLVSVHHDNPAYFDIEKWEWTTNGRGYLLKLDAMTGHRQQRMRFGRWVSAEGSVYPEFDESKHVVNPFVIPSDWPLFVGWDPGYDHVTAILWIAVGPTGRYYVVDEIYRGGRSVEEHVAEVKAHNREKWAGRTIHGYFGDPQHAFSMTAQAPQPISAQFKKAMGVGMTPWPRSKDKEAMVSAVRRRINSAGAGDDLLDIRVFRSCENTISEFQSWRYKRTAQGERPEGDDQFEDRNNHAMDVICGMVAMNLRYDRRGVRVIDPEKKK